MPCATSARSWTTPGRRSPVSDWAWEYFPDAHHVIGDTPKLALIAQIEERADELVRAAAVEYPDGTAYQGLSPACARKSCPMACSST
jgi:hypothetical protein